MFQHYAPSTPHQTMYKTKYFAISCLWQISQGLPSLLVHSTLITLPTIYFQISIFYLSIAVCRHFHCNSIFKKKYLFIVGLWPFGRDFVLLHIITALSYSLYRKKKKGVERKGREERNDKKGRREKKRERKRRKRRKRGKKQRPE